MPLDPLEGGEGCLHGGGLHVGYVLRHDHAGDAIGVCLAAVLDLARYGGDLVGEGDGHDTHPMRPSTL